MSDRGIKIALPNSNALSATPDKLILTSKYPSPKIQLDISPAHFDTVDYTFSSDPADNTTTTIATIAHGYSYIPAIEVEVKDFRTSPAAFAILPYSINGQDLLQKLYYEVDSTNLVIAYARGSAIFPVNVNGLRFIFKYYIQAENGA